MSEVIAIVGKSGTGKSTSVEGLNNKETYIISVAGKSLPIKGFKKLYNEKLKNYVETHNWKVINQILEGINQDRKDIKNIVIDDGQYLMGFEFMNRASEKGYDKFNEIGVHINSIFQTARNLRDDLNVFMLWHPEVGEDGVYKMKTVGRMIDAYITLEGLFEIILYTDVDTSTSPTSYSFVTNHTEKYPAKSPRGMFKEEYIPNDLSIVNKAISNYNN